MAGVLPLAAPSAAVGVAMIGSIVAGIGIAPVPAPTSDISADAVVDPVKARAHVRTLFVGESVADCGALAGSIDVALPVQSDVAIWSFVDVAAYLGDVGLVGLWRARKESYFRDFIPNFTETVFPLETILETSYPEVGPDVPDYPEFGPEVPDYPDR